MSADPDQVVETRVLVEGLNCSGCVGTLTRKVSAIDGVLGVEVDLRPGRTSAVVITHRPTMDATMVPGAVAGLGYRVAVAGSISAA